MKRTLGVALGVIVGLAMLVWGGTWVYLNVIREEPPERLSLDETDGDVGADDGEGEAPAVTSAPTTTVASAAAEAIADGTWRTVEGSEAGYRVPEVLNGQRTEGVGRTTEVTGEVVIAGARATTATFTVDLASVTSDEGRRDNQFRGRIMDVANHPTATFELTRPIDFGAVPEVGERLQAAAAGRLTLRGTTRDVAFDVEAERGQDTIRIVGSIPITFADYGIPNPSAGPAQVGDEGELEFLLVLGR